MPESEKESPAAGPGFLILGMQEASGRGVKLVDLPYRVVRDVHRKRASWFAGWCCNFDARKRLGAADPFILTSAAGNDM
jgi:hypothetical protein